MRRQGGQYMDSGINPMMQQQNLYPPPHQLLGSAYSTQDPVRPAADAHYSGASWSAEGQWQRDRDSGQGKAGSHGYMYDAQRRDAKHGMEKGSTDTRAANQNNSVSEGEYNDRMAVPQTIDALEQGFLQDLTKLLKEHHDAEDAEFSRHRERLNEINGHYQDKLAALRVEQGKIREEFLRKESQSRFQQYQQFQNTNPMAPYQNNNPPPLPSGVHHSYPAAGGYNMEAVQRTGNLHAAAYGAEGYHGGYGGDAAPRAPYPPQAGLYKSSDHPHGRGLEPRYAGGRGYNAGSRQH